MSLHGWLVANHSVLRHSLACKPLSGRFITPSQILISFILCYLCARDSCTCMIEGLQGLARADEQTSRRADKQTSTRVEEQTSIRSHASRISRPDTRLRRGAFRLWVRILRRRLCGRKTVPSMAQSLDGVPWLARITNWLKSQLVRPNRLGNRMTGKAGETENACGEIGIYGSGQRYVALKSLSHTVQYMYHLIHHCLEEWMLQRRGHPEAS
jgi:hypothetical protein